MAESISMRDGDTSEHGALGLAGSQRQALPFRPDIQGLRALAVLLVVLFHANFHMSGGFLGVDVFFVISGFVIGRMLLHEVDQNGRIRLGNFYSRRVRRLLPALSAVLVFVAVASTFLFTPAGQVQSLILRIGSASTLFVSNAALYRYGGAGYFDVSSANNPLLHMWTLSVEEQFYVFFPLLVIAVTRICRRRSKNTSGPLFWAIACAAFLSFIFGAVLSTGVKLPFAPAQDMKSFAFYASPTRAWEFLVGVMLVWAEPRVTHLSKRVSIVAGWVGLLLILGAAWFVTGSVATPGLIALIPVAGTALMITAGSHDVGWLTRTSRSKLAVWLGDRSYGWYLWHWPLIVIWRAAIPSSSNWLFLIAGFLALIPTEISYRFLEQPIRKNSKIVGWRAVRLGVICCITPLILLGLAAPLNRVTSRRYISGSPWNMHIDWMHHCDGLLPGAASAQQCDWRVSKPIGTVYLAGDSQAGAVSEGVIAAGNSRHFDVTIATHSDCPFAQVRIEDPYGGGDCPAFVTSWTNTMIRRHPSLIIIASLESEYVRQNQFKLAPIGNGPLSASPSVKAATYEAGLRKTLQAFSEHRIPVVVLPTVPQFSEAKDIMTCPTWRLLTPSDRCVAAVSLEKFERQRAVSIAADRAAMEGITGIHLVDLSPYICGEGICETRRNGTWLYRNPSHLSIAGATSLTPTFEAKVISVARPSG